MPSAERGRAPAGKPAARRNARSTRDYFQGVAFGLRGKWLGFLALGGGIGFLWEIICEVVGQFGALSFEAVEFLAGSAVLTFGLGLVTEEEGKGIGTAREAVETSGEGEGVPLAFRNFRFFPQLDVDVGGVALLGGYGFLEAGSEEAGFEAGGPEYRMLGQSHAFNGEKFLGVNGAVDVDEVGSNGGEFGEVFGFDDGEVGCGEAVLAGVLGGSGFAFGGAGSRGPGGIRPVGG